MKEGTPLYSILSDSKDEVHKWDFIALGHWNNHRLYYKDRGDSNGFDAFILSFVSGPSLHGGKTDIWSRETNVEITAQVVAYWDGIRHIHFTPDSEVQTGYVYYPNAIMFIEVFDNLRQLEEKYCRENDGNKY